MVGIALMANEKMCGGRIGRRIRSELSRENGDGRDMSGANPDPRKHSSCTMCAVSFWRRLTK